MTTPIQISEDILPISDFKVQSGKILRRLKKGGRPVVITRHGRPAGVLISLAEYDRLTERERFVTAVEEGLAAAEAGRTISHEEFVRRMEAEFGPLGDEASEAESDL